VTTEAEIAEIVFDVDRDREREKGVYVCSFVAVEPFSYTDKATGAIEHRWRWVFVDDKDIELDTITSTSFRPRTNGLKLFTGILGREPREGDKPSASYGKLVQCVWGENQGGKLTITDILPYKAPKSDAS
jgi:hypothetical protein